MTEPVSRIEGQRTGEHGDLRALPNEPASATVSPTPNYRIWVTHCPFRKIGTPVLGTMGATVDSVVVMRLSTWKRLCADVPQLQTTMFEVGTDA